MENLACVRAADIAQRILDDPGLVGKKSLNDLIAAIPEVRRLILSTAVRCLDAHKVVWDKQANDGKGGWERVDDGNTQMRAAVLLAAYSDGLPPKTVFNIGLGERGKSDGGALTLAECVARSPALAASLQAQIDAGKAMQVQAKAPRQVEALPAG